MDEIISDKMCAVKVRKAKLRNYLNVKRGTVVVSFLLKPIAWNREV